MVIKFPLPWWEGLGGGGSFVTPTLALPHQGGGNKRFFFLKVSLKPNTRWHDYQLRNATLTVVFLGAGVSLNRGGLLEGQLDGEGGPPARGAVREDAAAVLGHDILADG
jgi:hypothetical protein